MFRKTVQTLMHGKPTSSHKRRTQHSRTWWRQARANHLNAKPIEERSTKPHFPAYDEAVDRPFIIPQNPTCFQTKKPINVDEPNSYVWVPAGNAAQPTPAGYFFNFKDFKCAKCKFRFYHNTFYSINDEAWCVACALGRQSRYPTRRWHTSYVNSHRTGSRLAGHSFPRHKHQIEFLFDPEK